MGAVVSILAIIALLQAIFGLWILVKAYQVSFGWFLFLLLLGLGASMGAVGAPLGTAIKLGAVLLFVVNYWQHVRTPFLLFLAASVVHTVVLVQANRTLAEQQRAETQQTR
jgi:hypothetical protein